MTIPCANCGAAIAAARYRCPTCAALVPVDETAAVPSGFGGPPGDPAHDRTETVPWAIPIREGDPKRARPSPTSRDPRRLAACGVLAVALLAGILAIGGGLLGGGGDTETAGESEPDVMGEVVDDEMETDEAPTTTERADETTTTTTTTTSASSFSTTPDPSGATTSTTAPQPRTASAPSSAAAPARPGSAPVLASSFRGGWIAQLTSVPASTGEDAIEAAWSTARSDAAGAVVTRSDEWTSLEPGYWVVVAPGPFADVDEARAYCARVPDSARTECLPRELTGRR